MCVFPSDNARDKSALYFTLGSAVFKLLSASNSVGEALLPCLNASNLCPYPGFQNSSFIFEMYRWILVPPIKDSFCRSLRKGNAGRKLVWLAEYLFLTVSVANKGKNNVASSIVYLINYQFIFRQTFINNFCLTLLLSVRFSFRKIMGKIQGN